MDVLNEQAKTEIVSPETDPMIGQTIDSRYEVIRLIGAGGMGKVYEVKHLQLNRIFALKLLSKADLDKNDVARFNQEAKTASGLHHPNLVSITDHSVFNSAPYLVMEFAEGENLSAMIKRGPIPQADAIEIFIQVSSALSYAHSRGVIHRDIKPSNIMVAKSANGKLHARLVDFGIAKTLDANATNLTQTGLVLGTPGYMSPEQCTGNRLDQRSDIYSLGCVMFEALTGKQLFDGENNMQIVFKHINERPPLFKAAAPPGTPIKPEVERIVMQTLEKERENRYQNCDDLAKDLTLVAAGKNPIKEASNARHLTKSIMLFVKLCAIGLPLVTIPIWGYQFALQYQIEHMPQWQKDAMYGLSTMQQGPGNYSQAEVLLKRGWTGAIEANNISMIGQIAFGLAEIYEDERRPSDAASILEQAIAIDSKHPESDCHGRLHDEYSEALCNLGKYTDAEREGQLSYELKLKQFGKPNLFTKHSLDRVFKAQFKAEKYAEAGQTARKILAEMQTVAPKDDHAESPTAYFDLAKAEFMNAQYDAALPDAKKAMTLYLQLLGPHHSFTKNCAYWFATQYGKIGRADDAKWFQDQTGMTQR